MVVFLIDALLQSGVPSAGLTDVTGPGKVDSGGPSQSALSTFPPKIMWGGGGGGGGDTSIEPGPAHLHYY